MENPRASVGQGVVAVVPAKLTSVRLPRKNLENLGGHPLFWYSVRAAQLCPEIDNVYVSSEASEVLELANAYGAERILRPESLSGPDVSNLHVLRHALDVITLQRGCMPELLVLLQPTHPLRMVSAISNGIKQVLSDTVVDCLLTVVRADELRGEIREMRFLPEYPMPRNKAAESEYFRITGSFYIFRVASTLAQGRLFTQNMRPLLIERPEFEIDIDEAHDLALARCLLESNRKEFSNYFNREIPG